MYVHISEISLSAMHTSIHMPRHISVPGFQVAGRDFTPQSHAHLQYTILDYTYYILTYSLPCWTMLYSAMP